MADKLLTAQPLDQSGPLLDPVTIDIAGIECVGFITGANDDGTVQVHAFHPSGVTVHDRVKLLVRPKKGATAKEPVETAIDDVVSDDEPAEASAAVHAPARKRAAKKAKAH